MNQLTLFFYLLFLLAFQARKHSHATAKKASLGSIGVTPGDFVDYQRLSFDPTSMENTPTFKKKSISSIHAILPGSPSAAHRKASAGAFKAPTPTSVPHRHNSTGHYSAAVEASIRNLSQSPPRKGEAFPKTPKSFEEPVAPKPRTQSPDLLNEPKVTHFTFPDSCLETHLSNMPNEETSHHSSQLAKGSVVMQDDDENEELIAAVPFTSIAPDGQAHARSNADTPTLAEHADHLQTLLTLSSPSPTHLAEAVQPTTIHLAKSFEPARKSSTHTASSVSASASTTPRHKGLSGGGGLKGLLQRNIEASALAVYELQEQQRFRERPNTVHGATADQPSPRSVPVSPHLSVQAKGAGVGVSGSNVRPPVHARPSSSKASVRNGRQKTKEIDWAGPAIIPVYVAPVAAAPGVLPGTAPAGTSVAAAEPSAGPQVPLSANKSAPAVANEETMPRVHSRKENLQLPTEGNVNLNTMLLGSHTSQPSPQPVHSQDEAVVLKNSSGNATPVITPRASHPDMAVAGQRRSNISKKEKVTNAKLFM